MTTTIPHVDVGVSEVAVEESVGPIEVDIISALWDRQLLRKLWN